MQNGEKLIITNNPSVYKLFNRKHCIIFDNKFSFFDVLVCVRDNIHVGRRLLTHPLSGSVKPYETPYKTVILTKSTGVLDTAGLSIIENSIETASKFLKNRKHLDIPINVLKDFQLIDLDLVEEFL